MKFKTFVLSGAIALNIVHPVLADDSDIIKLCQQKDTGSTNRLLTRLTADCNRHLEQLPANTSVSTSYSRACDRLELFMKGENYLNVLYHGADVFTLLREDENHYRSAAELLTIDSLPDCTDEIELEAAVIAAQEVAELLASRRNNPD